MRRCSAYTTASLAAGIVGGPLLELRRMGEVSGQIAQRMLEDGSTPTPHLVLEAGTPMLRLAGAARWGIPESRLPAGAEVRFRPPSLWEQHRTLILAEYHTLLVPDGPDHRAALPARATRRAEKEAVGLSGRLLTAHEDERRRLARELHDDLTQRLARLAIDAGQIELRPNAARDDGRATALRKDLVRLSEDVHALSYRLHPSVLDDLGLVEALKAECDRVARHGALRVDVDARGVPEALPAETSLCLFRVAQEALSNAARHARASAVTVLLSPQRQGPAARGQRQRQSASTPQGTRQHASLGLASMRERVRLLQRRARHRKHAGARHHRGRMGAGVKPSHDQASRPAGRRPPHGRGGSEGAARRRSSSSRASSRTAAPW